jgi:hypothetical protein
LTGGPVCGLTCRHLDASIRRKTMGRETPPETCPEGSSGVPRHSCGHTKRRRALRLILTLPAAATNGRPCLVAPMITVGAHVLQLAPQQVGRLAQPSKSSLRGPPLLLLPWVSRPAGTHGWRSAGSMGEGAHRGRGTADRHQHPRGLPELLEKGERVSRAERLPGMSAWLRGPVTNCLELSF